MAILDALYPFPMNAVRGGQQVEAGFAQAEQEGEAFHQMMRDKLALRKASAGMGKSNYFTGYEGVPGAERPEYLKQLYAEGDPDSAIKLEQLQSEPFKIQRSIQTAGAIEAAKKAADAEYMKELFDHFMGPGGGAGIASAMNGPGGGGGGGEAPASGPEGIPSVNAFPLSGREKEFKIGPQGPQFGIKDMSQVDMANKRNEMDTRTGTLGLAKTMKLAWCV